MAEGRKRKKMDSSSSSSSSSLSKDPLSSSSELPHSSERSVSESGGPSCESLKSDGSMGHPLSFRKSPRSERSVSESGGPSRESLKSDGSMGHPLSFRKSPSLQFRGTEPGASTTESMMSDSPEHQPVYLDIEKTQRCSACEEVRKTTQLTCGHWTCQECVGSDWDQSASPPGYSCPKCGKKPKMKSGDDYHLKTKKIHKETMQKKFRLTSEGDEDQHSPLRGIYTTLYTIKGESEELSREHELRHLKSRLQKRTSFDTSVNLSDIFKSSPNQEKPSRTVLTKGVAGIGKSFCVQKFILDWAEDEENQDVDFVFCFALRELNLISAEKSLHELLTEFHPAVHHLKESEDLLKSKTIVILDGLDESRIQLDFENVKAVTSLKDVTSVGNLLVNLIQGNLLPDAYLWITSRPAAANQIPAEYVHMVTEIRGFSDPQKVEYFKKRFSRDLNLCERIVSHIQSSQSLDIMCQIPIFCWISAVLFQEVFEEEETEIPQTLTEMMAHFLFAQTKCRSRKYDKNTEKKKEKLLETHREFLLKLGKLAFVHLQENNLIFYEEDLEGYSINIEEASVFSGYFNTVLREEEVFSKKRVFFFVHLTVQEFFAALHVYECFTTKNYVGLSRFLNLKDEEHALLELLKMTVNKVLEKKNGHLDFFLRFLLGLMVEANQRVLKGLLTPLDSNQDVDKKILTYLRSIRRKTLSPDSCVNLFQTMVEMRDHKVKDEIQEYLKLSDRSKTELTPLHCSALAYMLQISKDELDELDLKSYNTSEEGRRRLIPAVRCSRKAVLKDCKVTEEWVNHLAFGLKFPFSRLRDLDLSNNDLRDSGVKLLCDGLSNRCCRLQILRLSGCMVTEEGCTHLVLALRSNPSHLTELDLSYNHPGESGEKMLSELRENHQYKLNILHFKCGGSHRLKPGFKKYACRVTLDPNTAHKNLLLSDGNRKVTWVEDEQPYPRHVERFDLCRQVLCEQGLKERCYFEVEQGEPFSIGLTYRSIVRKGETDDCKLGLNDKSWCLSCSKEGCYVQHDDQKICITSLGARTRHVGVYLDWEAGVLSFYKVSSDSLIRLHTFNAKFSEPLYPAAELHPHTSAVFS
ncbi:NACHT, LRR and PYD domains-containing protein 5-like [Melanotaenia boesemani]|uniref:NACHT, LRR and PYD domains-containing protein 5-like n=1 Tax=Melanotaenia boesemani TaxID=1250792 RepID=UPI001C04986B|nr:NACHT, LRR and PYD domains-containing protein 5-like [Melanotaenia boesemani]